MIDRRYTFARSSTTRIVIGEGVETQLATAVAELHPDGIVILHDAALEALATRIGRAVQARALLPVAGGEACKHLDRIAMLAHSLRTIGARRGTVLLVLGGGTLTDLGGMLGALYMRGMPTVLCPTTTLALCDAALGGKNGIDHDGQKNLLGTIRQPDLVVGDVQWLHTLPDEVFREGLVEVVKKAAVLDADHFARLELLAPALRAREAAATAEAVAMAVQMKMDVVLADESETDRRRWLNFGHTIGHALESHAKGALRHGAAIAMGMMAECRAAAEHVSPAVTGRLQPLLTAIGMTTAIPPRLADSKHLWNFANMDKKARGEHVPMVVPKTIGTGAVVDLTLERLARALA